MTNYLKVIMLAHEVAITLRGTAWAWERISPENSKMIISELRRVFSRVYKLGDENHPISVTKWVSICEKDRKEEGSLLAKMGTQKKKHAPCLPVGSQHEARDQFQGGVGGHQHRLLCKGGGHHSRDVQQPPYSLAATVSLFCIDPRKSSWWIGISTIKSAARPAVQPPEKEEGGERGVKNCNDISFPSARLFS